VATAKYLKAITGWRGDARAYELSEPLDGATHVIVSGVDLVFTGPETYIFPATPESIAANKHNGSSELTGSFRGAIDHTEALRRAGYEVTA
jgi:hypothetical protein